MTAVNAYAVGKRGFILTDTAGYDHSGVVRAFVPKVATIAHARMAFASRGACAALPALVLDIASQVASLDELLERGAEVIQATFDQNMMHWSEIAGEPEFDLVVVGWSDLRQRCEVHALSSLDRPGHPAFTWLSPPGIVLAPMPSMDDLRAAGLLLPNGGLDDRDPIALMLAVAELQRAARHPAGTAQDAQLCHIVGGHAVITEITDAGVSQRVARAWPDRLWQPITPKSASVPLSREQLRRQRQMARAS